MDARQLKQTGAQVRRHLNGNAKRVEGNMNQYVVGNLVITMKPSAQELEVRCEQLISGESWTFSAKLGGGYSYAVGGRSSPMYYDDWIARLQHLVPKQVKHKERKEKK